MSEVIVKGHSKQVRGRSRSRLSRACGTPDRRTTTTTHPVKQVPPTVLISVERKVNSPLIIIIDEISVISYVDLMYINNKILRGGISGYAFDDDEGPFLPPNDPSGTDGHSLPQLHCICSSSYEFQFSAALHHHELLYPCAAI
jgi:hypothetical protein